MRSPAVLVAVFVCTARASAQQPGTLHIGSAAARPGEMGSGFIEVPAGVDSGTRVPLTIVRGREPGPTLALIAGTHGDEVAPIIALQRVRRELDPARLRGTVLLVHVANLPSFLRRTVYYSPIDGKNLNRVYPGKRDGTVSERIADAITREIIERADYLVDIHAGDGNESLRPYTYWSPLGLAPRADSVARSEAERDRKSTRLNSSHITISYAVFCLKKKTEITAIGEQAPAIIEAVKAEVALRSGPAGES